MNNNNWIIQGKPTGSLPEVGQAYKVVHADMGTFFGRVEETDGRLDGWARIMVFRVPPTNPEYRLVHAALTYLIPAPPCFTYIGDALQEGTDAD